ncbi:MAG: signal transduction histidine kinase, partial [Natronomonas sp.]
TLDTVSRAITEATDATALARSLPAALTDPPENSVAWIGQSARAAGTIRIRASSPALPDAITDVENSATRRALDSGAVTTVGTEECPEYNELRRSEDVPAAATAVVIPVPALDHSAVVHLYTDGELSHPGASETFASVAELLAEGFEHRETARELRRERERLEQLRSLVSHDLGNPLNVAAGRLELVRTECDSDHIEHVESALKDIEALSDEGQLFVKAGRELDERSELHLDSLARECWKAIDDPDASLSVEPMTVYAEPERLRMFLNQLFDNAVVHTDGSVTVSVGPLPDQRGFYVEDDGPGIPNDERECVFDRGYTTVSGRDGYGLALVEEIAGALGWAVEVTEAEGTRIEVRTVTW